jgi:hypothetical protein
MRKLDVQRTATDLRRVEQRLSEFAQALAPGAHDITPIYHLNGNPLDCRRDNLTYTRVHYVANPASVDVLVQGPDDPCPMPVNFGFCNTAQEAQALVLLLTQAAAAAAFTQRRPIPPSLLHPMHTDPSALRTEAFPHASGRKQMLRLCRVEGELAYVPLGGLGIRREATIDAADLPLVESRNWSLSNGYAVSGPVRSLKETRTVSLARMLLGAQTGQRVEHINGDKLDNRRANLCLKALN